MALSYLISADHVKGTTGLHIGDVLFDFRRLC